MDSAFRRQFFSSRIPLYRADPVLFHREVLLFQPDPWQCDVLHDLANSPKVTVRSGQGVGKTGIEAGALLWFLCCFPFARVVATAPTRQQLNDVLWSEVAKWQSKSPLLQEILKWTKTYISIKGYEKRWFATARTATKPENMQGFHEDNMLFIVDEASGVADPIMEAILGTLSGANNKLLMCGNPTKSTGAFYDSHTRDRAMYKAHKVSSLDSLRTNKDNIAALMRKYGKDSNVVRVRILGEFPRQDDDVLIPITLAEQGVNTELLPIADDEVDLIRIGVDVARSGDDETVLCTNIYGDIELSAVRGVSTMRTTGKIVGQAKALAKRYKKAQIYVIVDEIGVGGGVVDRLRELLTNGELDEQLTKRLHIIACNVAKTIKSRKYADMTTALWSQIRELLEQGELRLPNDAELVAQLSTRKYEETSNGKLKVESKKDIRTAGRPSPDRADALAMACMRINVITDDRKTGQRG